MAVDKELTEFINKAIGAERCPKPKSQRQPREVIRYRWNLKEGGLTKMKGGKEVMAYKK